MERKIIVITGRVQGVNFRSNAYEKAAELGVTCAPENMQDGSLRVEAEGNKAALRQFIEWCRVGPPSAKVESVEVL